MGILHKLVYVLGKIDPETETSNTYWRMLQKKKAENEKSSTLDVKDKALREEKLIEINQIFEDNTSDYGRKLYLIENCIYGVDIQPIAVQISKLRFFISLVVDQKETDGKNRGIRPLPNLETKFVAANTLIGLQKPEGINFRSQQIIAREAVLWQKRHGHFGARTRTQKQNFQKKDKAMRKKIAHFIRADYAIYEQDIQKQIAQLQEQLALPRMTIKNTLLKAKYEKAFKEIEKKIDRLQQGLLCSSAIDDSANK